MGSALISISRVPRINSPNPFWCVRHSRAKRYGKVWCVFDLAGHPTATRAYAWSSPIEGSTKRRFFAVLHTERISSPLEAVRAAIVAEHKGEDT